MPSSRQQYQILGDYRGKSRRLTTGINDASNSNRETSPGGPLFVSPQALKSKSTVIEVKSRGLLLPIAKPGKPCFICGGSSWWWRGPSPLGGPGAWLCSVCHPDPNRPGGARFTEKPRWWERGIVTTPGREEGLLMTLDY